MVFRKYFFLFLYYTVGFYLPNTQKPIIGLWCNSFRVFCVRRIFKRVGQGVRINRKVYFGTGFDIEIGDCSGIGANSIVPSNIYIGNYVMMARDAYIHSKNHIFDRTDVPMGMQGEIIPNQRFVIEDDCWIGARVIMTPGRIIRKGTIVATGAVVTKDFEAYSIIGGNPAKLIRTRL